MNRLFKLAAACFIVFSCILTTTALAADANQYQFEATAGDKENRVTVEIPKDFLTFTRDTAPEDPNLAVLQTDAQTLTDYLKKNDLYLDAVTPDLQNEIFIKMNISEDTITVGNLSRFSDKELQGYCMKLTQSLKELGFTLVSYETLNISNQRYIDMHETYTYQDGRILYAEVYVTVINNCQVAYYFDNYVQDVTDSQKALLRHIVDTAEYSPKEAPAAEASPPIPENIEYRLDEIGLSVSIPSNLLTFTRTINPDDPNLAMLGTNAQKLSNIFIKKNIYLDAFSKDLSSEYCIKMETPDSSGKYNGFNQLSDTEISQIADQATAQLKLQGGTDITSDIYQQGQIKFIHTQFAGAEESVPYYSDLYTTLADGKLIVLKLVSYRKAITPDQENTNRRIVDSIRFNNLASTKPSTAPNNTTVALSVPSVAPYDQLEAARNNNPGAYTIGRIVGTLVFLGIITGLVARIVIRVRSKTDKKTTTSIPIWTVDTPAPGPQPTQIPNPVAPEVPVSTVICPTCGMKNQSDRLVCYRCGRALQQEPKTAEKTEGEDETE